MKQINSIIDYCSRKFRVKPGTETVTKVQDIVKELASRDCVTGYHLKYAMFVYWQLHRHGYSPIVWKISDYEDRYAFSLDNNIFDYHNNTIYEFGESMPVRLIKFSPNFRDWYDARDFKCNTICITKCG